MKNILSVIVLIFFLSISCQKSVTPDMIIIVPSDNDNIAAVIDDIEFIPLETNEDSMISNISSFAKDSGNLFILPPNSLIKMFDLNAGTYKRSIGQIGRGPGEASQIYTFFVEEGLIAIGGWSPNKKVNYYNTYGVFIGDITIRFPFNEFISLDSETYAVYIGNGTFSDEDDYSLLITDKNFVVKERLFKKLAWRDKFGMGSTTRFVKNHNSVYFRDEYDPVIYEIENKVPVPKYKLDFGKYWPTKRFFKENRQADIFTFFEEFKRRYAQFIEYMIADDYIIGSYYVDSKQYCFAYDLKNKTTVNSSEDKDPCTYLFRNFVAADGDNITTIVEAEKLLIIKEAINNGAITVSPEIVRKLNAVCENLSENYNPVIVKIKLTDI